MCVFGGDGGGAARVGETGETPRASRRLAGLAGAFENATAGSSVSRETDERERSEGATRPGKERGSVSFRSLGRDTRGELSVATRARVSRSAARADARVGSACGRVGGGGVGVGGCGRGATATSTDGAADAHDPAAVARAIAASVRSVRRRSERTVSAMRAAARARDRPSGGGGDAADASAERRGGARDEAGGAAPATLGSAGGAAWDAWDARSVGPASPGASRRGAARSRDRFRYPEGVERAAGAVGDGVFRVLSFAASPGARAASVPAGGGGGGETKDARRSRGFELARPTGPGRVVDARGGGGEGVSLPRDTRIRFAEVSATREDGVEDGVAGTSRERAVAKSPAMSADGAGRLACSLDRDAVSAPALKSCGARARAPHARACLFQSSHWHAREQ